MNYKETIESLRCCFGFGVCSDCKAKNMTEEDPLPCKLNCKERLGLHAADLIERLTAENAALREKVPRWISVEERRPEPGKRVLATDGVFVGEAYRTSADTWRRYDGTAMRDCLGSIVTHWMPLPEAPEGNNAT
uniref:DUF551 domain-containing protein n=1 Tax=Siphoviridae sp. ctbgC51 TaxID=2827901 RepID=A0A8S5TEM3_9CAUD|nr:MAG TPA: Protein of unknown function (DUF551) [Siphoviridae sp. ctbgC51]